MHEMALVCDVVDTVVEAAEESGAVEVKEVYLTIGMARDIVMDLLNDAFVYLTRDTIAKDAELIVDRVPIMARCNDCGMIYHIDVFNDDTWPCPRCGSKHYSIHTGREFRIDRIEVVYDKDEPACPEPAMATSGEVA